MNKTEKQRRKESGLSITPRRKKPAPVPGQVVGRVTIGPDIRPGTRQWPRVLVTVDYGDKAAKYRIVQTDTETTVIEMAQDHNNDALGNRRWEASEGKGLAGQLAQYLYALAQHRWTPEHEE